MTEDRRRGVALIAILLFGASWLTVRLFKITVLQHAEYVAKAQDQQNVQRTIQPRRGAILGQDAAAGTTVTLASSLERYAISATPRDVEHPAEYAGVLAEITGVPAMEIRKSLENGRAYMPAIRHGMTKDEVTAAAAKIYAVEKSFAPARKDPGLTFDSLQGGFMPYLGGTFFLREYQRTYPEGQLAGQLLGYVNYDGEGRYGFEGQYDGELKGYAGRVNLETDSRGALLTRSDQVDGQDGTTFELTIDRNVQAATERELKRTVDDSGAAGGSVVIMDPKTGEITAMASYPSYDPGAFNQVPADRRGLFDNPAISAIWEPGSIFKPIVMAAAMDAGAVSKETESVFDASVTVDGYKINTALNKAFGRESMTDVLVNSDNVAMVWVGDRFGSQGLSDALKRWGFGSRTGVDLKNEIPGTVLPLKRWGNISRATMTFGQGIGVTPLQIVQAYGAIANGGIPVRPRVVKAAVGADGTRRENPAVRLDAVVKPQVAADMRTMLTRVVQDNHQKAGVPGYRVAGKTGTAQVPDPQNGGYLADTYNLSFAGMAPAEDPKYVMLTKVDRPDIAKVGRFAEGSAVPLFGRLSAYLLHYYQIPPTNR